jgi:hypothetical protein
MLELSALYVLTLNIEMPARSALCALRKRGPSRQQSVPATGCARLVLREAPACQHCRDLPDSGIDGRFEPIFRAWA